MNFQLRTYIGSFQPTGSNSFNVMRNVSDPDGDKLEFKSASKVTDRYPFTISTRSDGTIIVNPIFTFGGGSVTDSTPTNNQRILNSRWKNFFARDRYPNLKNPKRGQSNTEQNAAMNLIKSRYSKYGPEIIEYTVCDEHGERVTCRVKLQPVITPLITPLAIDLDGDGSISRIDRHTRIDIDGDGTEDTLAQWFGANDGILIRVPQYDEVFSGEHLFGDQGGRYLDGFEKLKRLDTNGDRQINGTELDGLALWQDSNLNAKLEPSEIISLEQAQITTLGTEHQDYIGSATTTDGKQIHFEDVWFPILLP